MRKFPWIYPWPISRVQLLLTIDAATMVAPTSSLTQMTASLLKCIWVSILGPLPSNLNRAAWVIHLKYELVPVTLKLRILQWFTFSLRVKSEVPTQWSTRPCGSYPPRSPHFLLLSHCLFCPNHPGPLAVLWTHQIHFGLRKPCQPPAGLSFSQTPTWLMPSPLSGLRQMSPPPWSAPWSFYFIPFLLPSPLFGFYRAPLAFQCIL